MFRALGFSFIETVTLTRVLLINTERTTTATNINNMMSIHSFNSFIHWIFIHFTHSYTHTQRARRRHHKIFGCHCIVWHLYSLFTFVYNVLVFDVWWERNRTNWMDGLAYLTISYLFVLVFLFNFYCVFLSF